MTAGEVLVFILLIFQTIGGVVRMTVRALTMWLERHVGQPAADIIVVGSGVLLAFLLVRAAGRRFARWRGLRRMRALHDAS